MQDAFREAVRTNPTLYAILQGGGTLEQCVVALDESVKNLTSQLVTTISYSPKKIRTADGKIHVWRCPEELIPLEE
jgi:hypothetical protein